MSYNCSKLQRLYCLTPREKRIVWELADLSTNSKLGYSVGPKNDDIYEWIIILSGPQDSPYAKGTFFLEAHFPEQYPYVPPVIIFRTAIYHCNIDSLGNIQLDILQDKWISTFTMKDVISAITELLNKPRPDQALVARIGEHYLTSPENYDNIAREWTKRRAS